jgi:hypothetical protein
MRKEPAIRISPSFKDHPQRKKLKTILGPDSTSYLIDLSLEAAASRPDGILHGFDAFDLAMTAGWPGDPEAFVNGLIEAGFLDVLEDGTFALRGWQEHQPYLIRADTRDESAGDPDEARPRKHRAQRSHSNQRKPPAGEHGERDSPTA